MKLFAGRLVSIPVIILTVLLFIMTFSSTAIAANPNVAQWTKVGGVFLSGELVLGDTKVFTTSWTSDSYSRQKGLYWSGAGFWDPADKRNYAPWEDTVKNSVAPEVGKIVVKGPANVCIFQRSKGAGVHIWNVTDKTGFTPCGARQSWNASKKTWEGKAVDINPGGEFWGHIPARVDGKAVTLRIEAHMSVYDNQGGTGEVTFGAPQEVEYELWVFLRKGGELINVVASDAQCKKLSKDLSDYTNTRKMILKSISDLKKQLAALDEHSPFNTGYLNEYQNNTLGDDPVWNNKNLAILQQGSGGGTVSYLYDKEKWKTQINKSIGYQKQSLQETDKLIAEIKQKLQQLGCK
ncbi:MAG: hypothetical protein GY761_19475 [Hyphomicrobiales bacterium]|nr:hypothetical protein [Hyphomicrobiales bacterium]